MTSVRVLVVEDESIVAMDIQSTLESLGYEVVGVAATGEDAVKLAAEKLPDIVLMDIVLKGDTDGIEAAERIRESMDLPIVYLTAYSDDDTLARAKLTDPFGYILKPFEERELHTNIEMALHKYRLETDLRDGEQRYRVLFESSSDAMMLLDEGGFTDCNDATLKMFGFASKDDFTKVHPADASPPEQIDGVDSLTAANARIETAFKKGSNRFEWIHKRSDGTTFPAEVLLTSFTLKEKKMLQATVRDITERKRNEELERQHVKAEVYGFLISALPVFAGSVPAKVRDELIKTFGERFEAQMRPRFIEDSICMIEGEDEKFPDFHCFIHWIRHFFEDVGIETVFNDGKLDFQNCPWVEDARGNPVFCLMCRTMVMRSAGWTEEKVSVSHRATIAGGAETCCFVYNVSTKDKKEEVNDDDGE